MLSNQFRVYPNPNNGEFYINNKTHLSINETKPMKNKNHHLSPLDTNRKFLLIKIRSWTAHHLQSDYNYIVHHQLHLYWQFYQLCLFGKNCGLDASAAGPGFACKRHAGYIALFFMLFLNALLMFVWDLCLLLKLQIC